MATGIQPSELNLEQLKSQHATINTFLQVQNNSPSHASPGVRIAMQIYTHILEDALKTLNSLIQHLEPRS